MKYTREVVQAFLNMEDRTVEEKHWELIASMVTSENDLISDEEKLVMIRKPKNLVHYVGGTDNHKGYPHMKIDGYNRTILHYYPFDK